MNSRLRCSSHADAVKLGRVSMEADHLHHSQGHDMKRFLTIVVVASLAAATGCQQNKKSLSKAPPPPPVNPSASNQSSPPATFTLSNNHKQHKAAPSANQAQSTTTATGPQAQPQPLRTVSSTPASPASGHYYTIRKGDTLWHIAKIMLGNGNKWHEIVNANPGKHLSPRHLPVGEKIVIPQR